MLLTHSPLLGLFALGATAIGLNVGHGDQTIQNLRQKVSDHESDLSGDKQTGTGLEDFGSSLSW
jgi:hypothetical protein